MSRDDALQALSELSEKVKELQDLNEIRQLYIDYGRHLDAGDPVAYAALFSRDAKLRLGPVMRADGREDIERAATAMLRRDPDAAKSVHLIASPRIELAGDTASGECVWAAISSSEDGTPRVLVGRHVDELVREDACWRFAKRVGLIDVGTLG
jgi:uncharacterized protein (TIGR02246 family)